MFRTRTQWTSSESSLLDKENSDTHSTTVDSFNQPYVYMTMMAVQSKRKFQKCSDQDVIYLHNNYSMLYNHGSLYIIETHEFMEPTSPFGKGLQSHELENFFFIKKIAPHLEVQNIDLRIK